MKDYQNLIKKLFHLTHHHDKEKQFALFKEMVKLLNHPEHNYPTVHIAGTNGKGSVAYKMAQTFLSAHYNVGLYTSPHLIDYRERIIVNNEKITEAEVSSFLKPMMAFIKKRELSLNFFDLTTLLAFDFFAKKKVDIAIIETGIGGRFDATNVIIPLISIITSIGLDHQKILGPDLNAIAYQKGGIIKKNRPVVLGPHANFSILQKIAKQKGASIYPIASKTNSYDLENQSIAFKALEVLHPYFPTCLEARKKGLAMRPQGRFQRLQKNVILDGAHNKDGFSRLFQEIKAKFPKQAIYLIFTQALHKTLSPLIKLFSTYVQQISLFSSTHTKLKSSYLIAKELENMQFHRWKIYAHFKTTFSETSLEAQKNKGMILIAGSFYMMEEVSTLNPGWL